MSFLNYLISGISLGSIYAILALGYTMVYGIAKMLNFAHGDVIMVGAYICFFAASKYGLPPIVGVLAAVAVCTALGMVIEKLAYKPLRQATSLAVLITAIGVSYFLQNAALLLWTSSPKVFPNFFSQQTVNESGKKIKIPGFQLFGGQLRISYVTVVTIAACLVIMAVLSLFINRTKMGKAMRACSEDKGAAQLMGINVDATISVTFAIGSGLAAIAGVLLCSAYPTLVPTTGSMPGIKAFTAAVFGGIGSIPGALPGGVIEIMAKAYISTQMSDAVVFLVLIVVLLVKPAGLLGKKVSEKSGKKGGGGGMMLRASDMNVYYGPIHAVKNVSFEVNEGEIVTLIGANGAGKSTTLKTVSGLMRSKTGSIEFMGKSISGTAPHKIVQLGIAHMPEGRRIFTSMTVEENLDMGAYTAPAGDLEADKEAVFRQFPRLEERRKQIAGTLSGGEQQMLAMGRALMSHPKLLMLDEPSMGLAPILVEQVFDIIRSLHEAGTTILLVKQDAETALSIADRAYVLETGTVTLAGTGGELAQSEQVRRAYLGG